jgi:hypothetical protein
MVMLGLSSADAIAWISTVRTVALMETAKLCAIASLSELLCTIAAQFDRGASMLLRPRELIR